VFGSSRSRRGQVDDGSSATTKHARDPDRGLQVGSTAFEAADNAIDAQLCADLSAMIERSEAELTKLSRAIREAS
jgi:hypothetical protein